MAQQDLEDLIATLGKALKESLNAVEEQSINTFMDHFETATDENGKQTVRPKMITMPFPTASGEYVTREVPKVALLHHNSLLIEELRIRFRVSLSQEDGGAASLQAELAPGASISVAATPGEEPPPGPSHASNFAEVDIFFKRGEPPEGTARAIREFNKAV